MNNKNISFLGIIGVVLFLTSSILGGFLIDDYNIISQYISESYAIDTEYGKYLRTFGYIPSGILISTFCFLAVSYFHPSSQLKLGFYGIGIFYGLATVVVAIFPCDSGCNKELLNPSTSQLIHNFVGLLTYLFVPFFIILIGFQIKNTNNTNFSLQSKVLGAINVLFVYLLFSNSTSIYVGLYQRMVELVFVLWIILCAIAIKNKK
ncbi:DUF998 domain-containing protein [Flavicella marina]|uniref:DUF998 domain-containing protein n=1 Tax=Flavicella marina TaxID=1475951 RepID=UPI001264B58E|nr:DUF998 domain-containing protein [Flavicella marina]